MPSLANYWIATSFKDYLVENKQRLERKYIVPLNFRHLFLIAYTIGVIFGFGLRALYNGWWDALGCSFELSWFGFGWGKTPWHVALLGMMFASFCSGLFSLYACNTQLRFNNQEPVTFYQMYTLGFNTIKYEFYRVICKKTAFHWD
jgi:hypothetical protein